MLAPFPAHILLSCLHLESCSIGPPRGRGQPSFRVVVSRLLLWPNPLCKENLSPLAMKQGKPKLLCLGTLSPLTSPPSCKASRIPWGTCFANEDSSFHSERTESMGKQWLTQGHSAIMRYRRIRTVSLDLTCVHSTNSRCCLHLALPFYHTCIHHLSGSHLLRGAVKRQSSTRTHSFMSIIITVDSGHGLQAGTSLGCAFRSAAILSLQQSLVSLSFLSRACFSATPLPK